MRSNKLFTIAIAALFVLALARLELSLAAPIEHEDPDEHELNDVINADEDNSELFGEAPELFDREFEPTEDDAYAEVPEHHSLAARACAMNRVTGTRLCDYYAIGTGLKGFTMGSANGLHAFQVADGRPSLRSWVNNKRVTKWLAAANKIPAANKCLKYDIVFTSTSQIQFFCRKKLAMSITIFIGTAAKRTHVNSVALGNDGILRFYSKTNKVIFRIGATGLIPAGAWRVSYPAVATTSKKRVTTVKKATSKKPVTTKILGVVPSTRKLVPTTQKVPVPTTAAPLVKTTSKAAVIATTAQLVQTTKQIKPTTTKRVYGTSTTVPAAALTTTAAPPPTTTVAAITTTVLTKTKTATETPARPGIQMWGTSGPEYLFATDVDANNNVYIAGITFGGTLTMAGVTNTKSGGGVDAPLWRIDSLTGNYSWATFLHGPGDNWIKSISASKTSSRIYVGAWFRGAWVQFTGSTINVTKSAGSEIDGLIACFNSETGELIWLKQLVGNGEKYIYQCSLSEDIGVLYCGGKFNSTTMALQNGDGTGSQALGISPFEGFDILWLKLNTTTGDSIQAQNFGRYGDNVVTSLAAPSTGSGNWIVAATSLYSDFPTDRAFIVGGRSNGSISWMVSAGTGQILEHAKSIAYDPVGDYALVMGLFQTGNVTLGTGAGAKILYHSNPGSNQTQAWFARIHNSNGTVERLMSFTGTAGTMIPSAGTAVAVDGSGAPIVALYVKATGWTLGPNTFTTTGSGLYVAKLDPVTLDVVVSTMIAPDVFSAVVEMHVGSNGHIYLGSQISDSSVTLGSDTATNHGNVDFALIELNGDLSPIR